ncbi:efflux RND transporter periplasmic adaptor subunit [Myroides odoratus]|uniref:Efflux RND transporter periplasmic adaptor subunit n=1 Tax=Myroides odoratus TaxID=256 RepID=A0A9Q6Z645_MYROD|nr:efflux RND transporter periplasmic adaptor subunit [Myroides odoratus]EHQ43114.1 efflux transporter, RND family, MFP subunit [Myroides odoratus DSM 2801]EKB06495.1 efflux transporter, RND family, MFP subunit [Myroides odoratus CIP 103059]QQU00457.1 efflux RND transporter periplasmic adaptor subunit [Myroides odoratus]WQD57310.1 efflux RND transporter periplasmic adaptor subunit [Myroides odoratus]STZ30384.1 Macrolide-specific efflux protein macA precursor [Myroides odoratus]
MKKKYIFIVLALVVGLFVGIQFFTTKDVSTLVELAAVDEINLVETVSGTGKIQPEIEIKITPEVSGEIINLPVKEGQVVNKGDLLVVINPNLYESNLDRMVAMLSTSKAGLEQAEAQLKETKASFARNKTLFEKGVISGSEWDQVVRSYEVAKANKNSAFYNVESSRAAVEEAKVNLLKTTIYAPSAGTISRVDVELGERVLGTQQMAGTELLRVANLNSMEVEVNINENDIVKVKVGDETKINVDAFLKKEFKGIVTSISNSASNQTLSADQVTTFKVKIKILRESYEDLLDGKLEDYSPFRPGMTAAVDIITHVKNKVLAVPISAVVMRSPTDTLSNQEENKAAQTSEALKEAVFVDANGVAQLRFVKTGIQDDKNIEIVQGLKQGDVIITGPYSTVSKTLKHNDKIKKEETKE